MSKNSMIIGGVTILAVFGFAALMIASGGQQYAAIQTADPALLMRETSRMTGTRDARVILVEFGDYQCPACAATHPIVAEVLAAYQGNSNFNFVFRHFPLSQHRNAFLAAEAAEAAAAQGKFWEMHSKLYESQKEWEESENALELFTGYARGLGLDADRFAKEVREHAFEAAIRADVADGNDVSIRATPTFFLNGERMEGIPGLDILRSRIDVELTQ